MKFTHRGKQVDIVARTQSFYDHFRDCNDFEEHWMLNWIEDNVKRKGTWIDAGANIGNHSVHFSMFGAAEIVISFEPVLENFILLLENLRVNKCWNVIPVLAGLGENLEFASFVKHPEHADTLYHYSAGGTTPILTIDSMSLQNVNLMKIDVEGLDLQLMKGAINTIERDSPEIFIEAFDQPLIDTYTDYLSPLGYKYILPFNHGWMNHYSRAK